MLRPWVEVLDLSAGMSFVRWRRFHYARAGDALPACSVHAQSAQISGKSICALRKFPVMNVFRNCALRLLKAVVLSMR
jgi:hypothetical protein